MVPAVPDAPTGARHDDGRGPRRRGRGSTRRHALAVVAAVTGVALLAACGTPQATQSPATPEIRTNVGLVESDEAPRLGGSITYGLWSESNGWNPALNQWAASGLQVARTVYDTLTTYDEHADIKPYFATAVDHDDSYRVWTLTLREGVTYSNGAPVTGESVTAAQRLLKASPVVGAAYRLVESIDTVDEHRVRFTLSEPWTTFPTLLATQVGVVVEPAWMATNVGTTAVGTGAFTLDSWTVGSDLLVKKNTGYWQTDRFGNHYPYLDSIQFRVITEGTARARALESGDLDIAEIAEPELMNTFQDDERFQVFSSSRSETTETFVMLNTQVAPFDNIDARRAMAYATNLDEYNALAQANVMELADGPFSKSSPWYTPTSYPTYDLAKAKELVAKVKAETGSFSFTLRGPADATSSRGIQLLQQQYAAAGMDVQVEQVKQATGIIKMVTGDYQAGWFGGWNYPNPVSDLPFIDPAQAAPPPAFSFNFPRLDDPELSALMTTFRSATDESVRRATMSEIVRTINDNVPYIWLVHAQMQIVASRHLVNIVRTTLPDGSRGLDLSQEAHSLYQVWIKL